MGDLEVAITAMVLMDSFYSMFNQKTRTCRIPIALVRRGHLSKHTVFHTTKGECNFIFKPAFLGVVFESQQLTTDQSVLDQRWCLIRDDVLVPYLSEAFFVNRVMWGLGSSLKSPPTPAPSSDWVQPGTWHSWLWSHLICLFPWFWKEFLGVK